jgi:hypothetical protein
MALNLLATDEYYQEEDDPEAAGGDWICPVDFDWGKQVASWRLLCRHRSGGESQAAHPRPIIDHQRENVYSTSDFTGTRSIERVRLDLA